MEIVKFVREQWDRAGAVAAAVAGGLLLLLGWFGVSDAIYPGEQIPYIVSGGLGGIFLLGLAAVLWISADLRDEWRKLDDLDSTLVSLRDLAAALAVEQPAAPAATRLEGDADEPLGSVAPVRTPRRRARPATVA
jgi:hypothetical protein